MAQVLKFLPTEKIIHRYMKPMTNVLLSVLTGGLTAFGVVKAMEPSSPVQDQHVINGASKIQVTLNNNQQYDATVMGRGLPAYITTKSEKIMRPHIGPTAL
jgi:hypothetical protein